MNILITGSSGFIGFHLVNKLINLNYNVIGVDMMNSFYDINLKKNRLSLLKKTHIKNKFVFYKINLTNIKKLESIFQKHKIHTVINLAAQAGVRDSISDPHKYLEYNIRGFLNIIELSKKFKIKHFVYASTSSVYGLNKKLPYKESNPTCHPIQFYSVTKKTNELMAHAWSHLFNMPTTGLRFFTVYGPWGRPDMALYNFVENIQNGKKINLYNKGNHIRDFTYVSDIVDGIVLAMKKIPKKNSKSKLSQDNSSAPYQIFNLGCGKKVKLKEFVAIIEKNLAKKAKINYLNIQAGDVHTTIADISSASKILKYKPKVMIEEGIKNFVKWYIDYKKNN